MGGGRRALRRLCAGPRQEADDGGDVELEDGDTVRRVQFQDQLGPAARPYPYVAAGDGGAQPAFQEVEAQGPVGAGKPDLDGLRLLGVVAQFDGDPPGVRAVGDEPGSGVFLDHEGHGRLLLCENLSP